MEPQDFFTTAELLKDKTEEPHIRTSVGRSYYAAFLYYQDYLGKLGLKKTKNPGQKVHIFVINCLGFSQNRIASKISGCLNNLKQLREDADYHLEKQVPDADSAFEQAKIVVSYRNNITPQDEKQLIEKAKEHARFENWI